MALAPRALAWPRALEERQFPVHVVAALSVCWPLAKLPVRVAESVLTDVGLLAQAISLSEPVPADSAAAWTHSVLRWLMTD